MDVIQPASVSALTTLAHTLTTLAHALIQVLHAIKPWLAPFAIPLLAIVYAQILDLYDSFCIERSFFRNLKVLVNPAQKNFFFKRGFVDELKHKIIPTNSLTSKYLVVTGAHGNGKSSMVHHIVDELTNGVHYVACPSNAMRFGEAFSDSISYSSMYRPSVIRQAFQASSLLTSPMRYNGRSFIPIFEACLNKYTRAAARYTRITGKVPILVIDAINRFTTTKEGSSFLMELQMLAKDWAVQLSYIHPLLYIHTLLYMHTLLYRQLFSIVHISYIAYPILYIHISTYGVTIISHGVGYWVDSCHLRDKRGQSHVHNAAAVGADPS